MTYLVSQLITEAWYTTGIVARDLQTLTADQVTDGLNRLNDLLSVKTANRRMIPYYTYFVLNMVAGQEVYFIPNLVEVESETFNIGPVRFPMNRLSRRGYFGSPRVDNINALPFTYFVDRVLGGSNVYVYFLPESNYVLKIQGKFSLTNVNLNTDLSTIVDQFYIVYLRYGLAEYLCNWYNISPQPENTIRLRELEAIIDDFNPIDFTLNKISSFTKDGGLTWGDVNIGKGWRPY